MEEFKSPEYIYKELNWKDPNQSGESFVLNKIKEIINSPNIHSYLSDGIYKSRDAYMFREEMAGFNAVTNNEQFQRLKVALENSLKI